MTAAAIARRIQITRGLRGLVDGLVSVLLAAHLARLGFSATQIGAVVTGTLIGSALLTVLLGLVAHRVALRKVLLAASLLMIATGIGFAGADNFWVILAIAVIGTLNPSAGDVSVFLPAEQAVLAHASEATDRTGLFARYNLGGAAAAGIGALLAGLPTLAVAQLGVAPGDAERAAFLIYAGVGVLNGILYLGLPAVLAAPAPPGSVPLAHSRRTVMHLALLFSLDSFGGGFAVQSLLVLWLHQRFGMSTAAAGQLFFFAGFASAASQLVSARLVSRIGHVRTMVYTHLPANLFLILAGAAPTQGWAVTFLLLRAALSQMDVPARQAFVMSVVPAAERPAAASLTNVPRSLASAIAPMISGMLLERSSFGWPLICGGIVKAIYDFWLLAAFRDHAADDV